MKRKLQNLLNNQKRNNASCACCNYNNTNYISSNINKCDVWRKWINNKYE